MLQFVEGRSPLPGMRSWLLNAGYFQFVVVLEDGKTLSELDRRGWQGYTATYKAAWGWQQPSIRIEGLWGSLEEAQAACWAMLSRLRQGMIATQPIRMEFK